MTSPDIPESEPESALTLTLIAEKATKNYVIYGYGDMEGREGPVLPIYIKISSLWKSFGGKAPEAITVTITAT